MKAEYEQSRDKKDTLYFRFGKHECDAHFHQQFEILYNLKGGKEVTVNKSTVVLEENQIAVSDSFDIHAYKRGEYALVVIIPYSFLGKYTDLKGKGKLNSNFYLEGGETAKRILFFMNKLSIERDSLNELEIEGYVELLLGTIVAAIGFIPFLKSDADMDLMRNLLRYLEENFAENITLVSLSEKFGYSKYYFSHLFNSILGSNLKEYLNGVRLQNVIKIMRQNKDADILGVALESGFSSVQTFYRSFKKTYGVPPKVYLD